jgi:hypothetical protein
MVEVTPHDDDVSMSLTSKVVVIVFLVAVALVAFSIALEDDGTALDKLMCAAAGVGAVTFAWKTAVG